MSYSAFTRTALLLIAILVSALTLLAQSIYIPPGYHPDEGKGQVVHRKNAGQRRDTQGNSRPDVIFTTEGSPVVIDAREKSKVSYTLPFADGDTATVDTLYRIDMGFRQGRERSPVAFNETADKSNYYIGPNAYVTVPAYRKLVYWSIYDSVDVHFTQGTSGPRMAFVVRPGGTPESIFLTFTGQDSLHVDWQGALKLYVDSKWMKFEQAIAYQVDGGGNINTLNWLASYEHVDGTSHVKFDLENYDTSKPLVLLIGYAPLPAMGGGGEPNNLDWATTAGRDQGYLNSDHFYAADHLPDNDLIVAGATADAFFPANPGGSFLNIGRDVFVSSFNYAPGDPNNDAKLQWTTFLVGGPINNGNGGQNPSGSELPVCIKYVAAHDRIYVAGWSNSNSWPVIPPTNPNDGSYYQDTEKGISDAFMARLNPELGQVDRSTQYGGQGIESITAITADAFGRVHFYGITDSQTGAFADCNSPDTGLPLCDPGGNAYMQTDNAGGMDMFKASFNGDFELVHGTFIGGAGDDRLVDADYLPAATSNFDRLAIVGRTTGTLPYPAVPADFQLNNANGAGFVWLFNSNGRPIWGTHIDGTYDLQAVSFAKEEVRVLGRTNELFANPIVSSCDAVPGSLSICGGDSTPYSTDFYIGEFDLQGFGLLWSTLENGATLVNPPEPLDRYHDIASLYGMYRYMDMQTNADDDFMIMGMVGHVGGGALGNYPTVPLWGMYHKPYSQTQGDEQSEAVITLYRHTHERIWSTTFGAEFQHFASEPYWDWYFLQSGCDYPHSLVWVDGEVLYLVGTTGGQNFNFQCPYPDVSYCESSFAPLSDLSDYFDGMIARFNLQDITIGLIEPTLHTGEVTAYPSPAEDVLYIRMPGAHSARPEVIVRDAVGRICLRSRYAANAPLRINGLSAGTYLLEVLDERGGRIGNTVQ